jgi:hypothetical protein
MKKSIQLSIPNPCSEKWENFTPTSTGGFCGSCFKTVVDFTKMSDTEIMQFLKDKPAHTCGRFRNDQLKEYTELPVYNIRPSHMLLKAGLISLLLALVGRPSMAQTPAEPVTKEVVKTKSQQDKLSSSIPDQLVKGVVKDEERCPIPGTNVLLVGTSVGTTTDADGRFEFPQRLKEGDMLMFSFIGYKNGLYRVGALRDESITITMDLDVSVLGELIMVGEVSIDEPYTPRKDSNSLLAMIKRWF